MSNLLINPTVDLMPSKATSGTADNLEIGDKRSGSSSEKNDEFLPVLESASESDAEEGTIENPTLAEKKGEEKKDTDDTAGAGAVCALPSDQASPLGWLIALNGGDSGSLENDGEEMPLLTEESGEVTIVTEIGAEENEGAGEPVILDFSDELAAQEATAEPLEGDEQTADADEILQGKIANLKDAVNEENEEADITAAPEEEGDESSGSGDDVEVKTAEPISKEASATKAADPDATMAEESVQLNGKIHSDMKKEGKQSKSSESRTISSPAADEVQDTGDGDGISLQGIKEGTLTRMQSSAPGIQTAFEMGDGSNMASDGQGATASGGQANGGESLTAFPSTLSGAEVAAEADTAKAGQHAERAVGNQLFTEIVDKAVLVKKNGQSEFNIALKPEFLGQCRMKIATQHDQVTIRIIAETPVVKEAIEQNLSQLKSDLQNAGLKLDSIDVQVSDDSDRQSGQNQSFASERRSAGSESGEIDGELTGVANRDAAIIQNSWRNSTVDYFA